MQTTDEITNTQDIIDSRDVIARIEYLQDELDSLINDCRDAETEQEKETALAALAAWLGVDSLLYADVGEGATAKLLREGVSDEAQELRALLALAEDAEGYCDDWRHGATLIRDSYFEEYAQQLAEDIGAINRDATWPNDCIDWEKAARELQADYTAVDFDGVQYWVQ